MLGEKIDWTKLSERKFFKIDLNFIPASPATKFDTPSIINLDRFVLRSRRHWKIILRVNGKNRLLDSEMVSEEINYELQGKVFLLMLRTAADAEKKMAPKIKRRIERSPVREKDEEFPDVPRTPGKDLDSVKEAIARYNKSIGVQTDPPESSSSSDSSSSDSSSDEDN